MKKLIAVAALASLTSFAGCAGVSDPPECKAKADSNGNITECECKGRSYKLNLKEGFVPFSTILELCKAALDH